MVKELIPVLERRFRMIGEPWARTLTGGSTGGWEAIAQQVFYPSVYSGTWSLCPDPVDFRYHQLVNVYSADNAYFTPYEWEQVPRPSAREVPGDTIWTMEQENHWELALGTNGRSQLGQWDVWQAVYGPQGADGYPAPIWDKVTGAVDHAIAKQWHPMDIRWYLNKHWSSLGPRQAGADDGERHGSERSRGREHGRVAHRPPGCGAGAEADERGGVRAEGTRPVARTNLRR